MKKIVVLSGAGISAESGIRTFRDSDGLWEGHNVMDVASYDGWLKNQELVLSFYNDRRTQLKDCEPNKGHRIIAELEKDFDVHVITQNVDNLHERAGSTKILHLHGELTKVRSEVDENDIRDIGYAELKKGDLCAKGKQLRPHIVWFGEAVPTISEAIEISQTADVFIVIGTSLNVYPAAGLVNFVPKNCKVFLIDPNDVGISAKNVTVIKDVASSGMAKVKAFLDIIH